MAVPLEAKFGDEGLLPPLGEEAYRGKDSTGRDNRNAVKAYLSVNLLNIKTSMEKLHTFNVSSFLCLSSESQRRFLPSTIE